MKHKTAGLPVIISPVFVNGTALLRSFGRRGAYCVAISSTSAVPGFQSRYAREKVLLPGTCDSANAFTQWLLSRSDLYGGLVIPTGDEVLLELDANRELLEKHYKLVIPPRESCLLALDKASANRVAEAAGVPIPRSVTGAVVFDPESLGDAGGLGFPVIVKPLYGIEFQRFFSAKVVVARDAAHLGEVLGECRKHSFDVLLQDIIPPEGDVGAYSAYVSRSGRIVQDYSSRRLGLFPPVHGIGYLERSEFIDGIMRSGRKFIKASGFTGSPVNLDFKFDTRDGVWKLLDFNARSWRQVSMAPHVGLDVAGSIMADYTDAALPVARRPKWGVHWLYLKEALLVSRGYPEHALPIGQYLSFLASQPHLGLFDLTDLRPFLRDIAPLIKRRLHRSHGVPRGPAVET